MDIRTFREDEVRLAPPSLLLLMMEGRAFAEYAQMWLTWPFLRDLPRGDGHPVLIVPGFGASDRATLPLRRALARLGYAAHGWEQGRNLGMRGPIKEYLNRRLAELHERYGAKVSLIGWSLGGVFVRELARHQPQHVRRIVTLGSPFNGRPDANNLMPLFRYANRGKPVNLDWDGFQRRRVPPSVPCTAVYTRSDGIIAWQCCLEETAPNTENVCVSGSHLGMVFNARVLRVIAERLARPES